MTEKKPDEVILILSQEEAATLYRALRRVGGDPEKSARKYVDSMISALEEIGFPHSISVPELMETVDGHIMFGDFRGESK